MFLGEQHNDLTTSPPTPVPGHTPAVPTTAVSCQTGEQQSLEKPTVQEPKLFYFGLGHRECCFLFVNAPFCACNRYASSNIGSSESQRG